MRLRFVLLLVVILSLAFAYPAAAEVRRTIRVDSVPSGAQVFLLVAGERTAIGTTPFDYAAEFHSDVSVLRLSFERAGFAALEFELTPVRDRVVATLAAAMVVASAANQGDPSLKALQDRIAPGVSGAIRQMLASKTAAGVQIEGGASLRRIDGAVYLEVPLALDYGASADAGGAARRLWREIGAELTARIGKSLPANSGVAGVVMLGGLRGSGPAFGVSSHAESSTQMSCLPGMKQVYDSCATQQPTYETSCYNGSCSTRPTGTRCAGGMKSVYDACATMGPLTTFKVKVDPQAGATASGARVVVVASFTAGGAPTALAQVDERGRVVFREGRLPAALDASSGR